MPRKAPTPSVRFILNPKIQDEEKIFRKKLSEAHILAVRSFISSLNLSTSDRKAMKKLLS